MSGALAQWVMYLGMAVAMVGGAPWPRPNWVLVGLGLVVIAGGVVWRRAIDRRAGAHAAGPVAEGGHVGYRGAGHEVAAPEGSIAAAKRALPAMLERVRELASAVDAMPLGELSQAIEAVQQSGTEVVAAAQDALVRAHTFASYATVMAPLATGERLLYRAWSAASDGHRPEAKSAIAQALPYLEQASEALARL